MGSKEAQKRKILEIYVIPHKKFQMERVKYCKTKIN